VILPRSIPHASWGIGWGADTALPRLPYAASGTRASRAASRPSTMAALVTVVVLTVAAAVVAAAATATTTTATTTTTTTTTTSPRGPVVDGTAGASSPGCNADSEHGPRPWRASATWTAPSHRPSIYLPPLPAFSLPSLIQAWISRARSRLGLASPQEAPPDKKLLLGPTSHLLGTPRLRVGPPLLRSNSFPHLERKRVHARIFH
jgi:hypothetical protein